MAPSPLSLFGFCLISPLDVFPFQIARFSLWKSYPDFGCPLFLTAIYLSPPQVSLMLDNVSFPFLDRLFLFYWIRASDQTSPPTPSFFPQIRVPVYVPFAIFPFDAHCTWFTLKFFAPFSPPCTFHLSLNPVLPWPPHWELLVILAWAFCSLSVGLRVFCRVLMTASVYFPHL